LKKNNIVDRLVKFLFFLERMHGISEWLKVTFLLGFETERGKEQLPEPIRTMLYKEDPLLILDV